ncbi:hypothetical protein V1264_005634 [Littorina saxatilis]|uniref:Uncharacterized protein n=1 Tax=Littorina saxatilis TaxID=31220 RepID=A0AAN9AZM8_9CAEN
MKGSSCQEHVRLLLAATAKPSSGNGELKFVKDTTLHRGAVTVAGHMNFVPFQQQRKSMSCVKNGSSR